MIWRPYRLFHYTPMKNHANLADAANLLAVAESLAATIGGVRIETTYEECKFLGTTESTVINLSRELANTGRSNWSQVFITVRRPNKPNRRASVTVRTQHDYKLDLEAGLWAARYAFQSHKTDLTKEGSLYRVATVSA